MSKEATVMILTKYSHKFGTDKNYWLAMSILHWGSHL